MNRLASLALAAALLAPVAAYADDGHWVDVRRHMSLENSPNGSDAIARLDYAKDICRSRTGIPKAAHTDGAAQVKPAWTACMKAQDYVWLWDSAAQVAANRKAEQDERNRETLHAIGGALIDAAQAMQPHGCNGHVQPNGYFSTQCF
jgi:hypothetical protein